MADEYAFSHDGERFDGSFATREEALHNGIADDPTRGKVWTGVQCSFDVRVEPSSVLDQLAGEAEDFAGEFAEGWLHRVPKAEEAELGDMLTSAFVAWMEKHGHAPTFYGIGAVEEHAVEAQP
jgi:hypothetical protein